MANLLGFLLAIVAGTAFNESRQRLDLKSKVPCTLALAVVTRTSIDHLRMALPHLRRIPVRASGLSSPCWIASTSFDAPHRRCARDTSALTPASPAEQVHHPRASSSLRVASRSPPVIQPAA